MKTGMLCVLALGLSAAGCAIDNSEDSQDEVSADTVAEFGGDDETDGEGIEEVTSAFTEASCSTANANVNFLTWPGPNLCPNNNAGGYQAFATSPSGTYGQTSCTNAYIVDNSQAARPQKVWAYWGDTRPGAALACLNTRVRARVFAYAGPYVLEVTPAGGLEASGSYNWTTNYCTTPSTGSITVPSSIAGYQVSRVRVVANASNGSTPKRVSVGSEVFTCIN